MWRRDSRRTGRARNAAQSTDMTNPVRQGPRRPFPPPAEPRTADESDGFRRGRATACAAIACASSCGSRKARWSRRRFTANACALCVAAASVLTELATGAPLDEVDTLTVEDLLSALGASVPEARRNCVRLPLTVLHAGVMLHRRANRLPRGGPVAAGGGDCAGGRVRRRRFGAQKLLAPYGTSTVVRTVVDTVRAAGVDYLVVVGGPGGEAVRAAVGGPACRVGRKPRAGPRVVVVGGHGRGGDAA